MNLRILSCEPAWRKVDDCDEVARHVAGGGLVVVPTDTVYGIGANAQDPHAVRKLLEAKGRGRQMPPPVLVASPDALDALACEVPEEARRLAAAHWPGALTLILRARPDLTWDLGETAGTIALRMPRHAGTCHLIEKTGPLAVSSANLTGCAPATTVDEATRFFGDSVIYVDGGPTPGMTPSTIIDCAHGAAQAVRLGALSLKQLSASAGVDIRS